MKHKKREVKYSDCGKPVAICFSINPFGEMEFSFTLNGVFSEDLEDGLSPYQKGKILVRVFLVVKELCSLTEIKSLLADTYVDDGMGGKRLKDYKKILGPENESLGLGVFTPTKEEFLKRMEKFDWNFSDENDKAALNAVLSMVQLIKDFGF